MNVYLETGFQVAFPEILVKERPRKILLFTGKSAYLQSPIKAYFDSLEKDYKIFRYSDFDKNPQYFDVLSALEQSEKFSADMVVALGGGSVIDFAKLVTLFSSHKNQFITDFRDTDKLKVSIPFVAIPTTSGSGSEATHFAVMYRNGEKFSIASNQILPPYSIVDPVLSYSMNPYITACSGMDAFCQALESLWAKKATDESRQYALKALELIWPNLKSAVNKPDSMNRKSMATGAFYAGKAINISQTTAPHALAYYLTDKHGIPHGEAVGMNIHHFVVFNWPALNDKIINFIESIFKTTRATVLASQINRLKTGIGLKMSIKEINSLQIDEYLKSVNLERLSNNPFKIDIPGLKRLLTR